MSPLPFTVAVPGLFSPPRGPRRHPGAPPDHFLAKRRAGFSVLVCFFLSTNQKPRRCNKSLRPSRLFGNNVRKVPPCGFFFFGWCPFPRGTPGFTQLPTLQTGQSGIFHPRSANVFFRRCRSAGNVQLMVYPPRFFPPRRKTPRRPKAEPKFFGPTRELPEHIDPICIGPPRGTISFTNLVRPLPVLGGPRPSTDEKRPLFPVPTIP